MSYVQMFELGDGLQFVEAPAPETMRNKKSSQLL